MLPVSKNKRFEGEWGSHHAVGRNDCIVLFKCNSRDPDLVCGRATKRSEKSVVPKRNMFVHSVLLMCIQVGAWRGRASGCVLGGAVIQVKVLWKCQSFLKKTGLQNLSFTLMI